MIIWEVSDDNINEIMDNVVTVLKSFDNFSDVEDKINVILNSVRNHIEKIGLSDDGKNLYIFLYGCFYGINYDFKNYPLFSFYCQSLKFNIDDCGIVNDEFSDVTLNLHEIDLKNFERME